MDIEKILTVNDVADILQVKPITVREMFREKRLRAFKVGKGWRTTRRMLEEDIEALSHGEAPPVLPGPPKNLPKREEVPPDAGAPKVAKPAPAPAPAPESEAIAPKRVRKSRKTEEDSGDDSQGLLF